MNIIERAKANRGVFYNTLYPFYQSKPYFIPPDEIKQREILELNWNVFLEEFLAYQNKGLTKNDVMRTGRGYNEPGLKTVTLITNMYRYHKRCAHFPRTMKILEAIPELSLLTINVLHPGTNIRPHYGETDATYRCHLGLIVPAQLPECGIRVGNEIEAWEEGKILAFIDANRHKVWNNSQGDRVILLADFIRPGVKSSKWMICGRTWSSLIMSGLIVRWNFLKQTPFFIAEAFNILLAFGFIAIIWLQRTFRFELPYVSRN